ncbi:MAG: FadR family transcriptional regulator [Spirochaetes bacterium]|nr:FadR family transcriptional regulator [Spirochaetota bacterium]
MATFKPIGRQVRVSEAIIAQLKQFIVQGHFTPGSKLPPERDLAKEFQVSRVAIHEALRTLENTGFVIIKQGATGGTFVTDLTFEYLSDAFLDLFLSDKISIPELHNVRLLIEPEIARLAALAITPEYAERLQTAIQSEDLPDLSLRSLRDDIKYRTAVHRILAEMCSNRFYEAILISSMRLTHKVIEIVNPQPPYSIHPPGSHRAIVKAVLAGNAKASAEAMRKHSIEFGKILLKMEKTYRAKSKV